MKTKKTRGKNKSLLTALGILALLLGPAGVQPAAAQPVALSIYAFDGCGGCFGDGAPCQPCTVLDGLYTAYYELLEQHGLTENATIRVYNTKGADGMAALTTQCAALGIDAKGLPMPLVIVGGDVFFTGERAVTEVSEYLATTNPLSLLAGSLVPQDALDKPDSKTLVYFYTELCGDCVRARASLADAESAMQALGLTLLRYNVDEGQNFALMTDHMRAYGVAHESATVPFLFWGEDAYHGSDAIGAALAALDGDA